MVQVRFLNYIFTFDDKNVPIIFGHNFGKYGHSVMIRKRKIQTHLAARHSLAVLLSRSGIENMYKVEV